MHARLFVVVGVVVLLSGCSSQTSSSAEWTPDAEWLAAAAAWQEELAKRRAAIERTAPIAARAARAQSPPAQSVAPVQPSLLERMMDADGKGMCNIRLADAARAITATDGTLHRWTTTNLDARFPEKGSTTDPDVITYYGDAIEFMEDDGSWLRAVYGCDYDHDAGEVVRVRTAEW